MSEQPKVSEALRRIAQRPLFSCPDGKCGECDGCVIQAAIPLAVQLEQRVGELEKALKQTESDCQKLSSELNSAKITISTLENTETVKSLIASIKDVTAGRIKPWSEIEPGLYELETRQLRERIAALEAENAELRGALRSIHEGASKSVDDRNVHGYALHAIIEKAEAALERSEAARAQKEPTR